MNKVCVCHKLNFREYALPRCQNKRKETGEAFKCKYIAHNGFINMKGCIRNVIKSLIYSYRLFDKVVSLVPQEFPEIICLRGRVGQR